MSMTANSNKYKIKGFHANDSERCKKFLSDNYFIVSDDTHWLGRGMYFWDNESNAVYWAKEKFRKDRQLKSVWIVKADIILDDVLDLTDSNALRYFEAIWNEYCQIKEISPDNVPIGKRVNYLLSFFSTKLPFTVVKCHAYYPKTPPIHFLDKHYKDLPEPLPSIDYSTKTIYCVKTEQALTNRSKIKVISK